LIVRDLITEKSIKADSNYDALIQLKNDLETIDVVDLRDDLTRHTAESANKFNNLDKKLENIVGTRRKFYDIAGEMQNIKKIYIIPFDLEAKTIITSVSIEITENIAAATYEIGIYDSNFSLVTSSGVKETFSGVNDVNTELEPGRYYFAISCNNVSIKFKSVKTDKALSSDYSLPLPSSLTNLYEEDTGVYFEIYSSGLRQPTGFSISQLNNKRVFAVGSSGALYGWNISTWKVCKSVAPNVWTDLMDASPGGFWAMEIDETNGNIYTLTGAGKIYKSSDLTETATWSDITPDITLQRVATSLPYSMKLWGGYLWFGEYSYTGNELVGDPIISRYNVSTGAWKKSAQIANCRHIHAFISPGTSMLFVSCGDLGTGENVGYHMLLPADINDTTGDTWTRWTKTGGENNTFYDVDSTIVPHIQRYISFINFQTEVLLHQKYLPQIIYILLTLKYMWLILVLLQKV
jgi:hypothetical protein